MKTKYYLTEQKEKTDFWIEFVKVFGITFMAEAFIYMFGYVILFGNRNFNVQDIPLGILLILNAIFISSIIANLIKEKIVVENTKLITLEKEDTMTPNIINDMKL